MHVCTRARARARVCTHAATAEVKHTAADDDEEEDEDEDADLFVNSNRCRGAPEQVRVRAGCVPARFAYLRRAPGVSRASAGVCLILLKTIYSSQRPLGRSQFRAAADLEPLLMSELQLI